MLTSWMTWMCAQTACSAVAVLLLQYAFLRMRGACMAQVKGVVGQPHVRAASLCCWQEEGGFLGDMDEEEEEEPGSRGRSTPAAEKSENEGDAAAEDEEEDHDEEEEDDDEDDDDLDDEVDVESLRAWGIDPEDPLALAHMPNIEGEFAPTVREPWRPERELKRVRGRAKKTGRKTTRRKR